YKEYMAEKFLDFYNNNPEYKKENNKRLLENQKLYWSKKENREKCSERVRIYFQNHPEKKEELSQMAKIQWDNKDLLEWRKEKTSNQWTPEFRVKRKEAYNQTYLNKGLSLLKEIYEKYGKIDVEDFRKERIKRKDKCILKYDTICQRFFNGNEKKLEEAVLNYNHKIKKIVKLSKKIDVYDIEVENTHNFALASGIFVHNSGKQGRNRRFQAILPLRGKVLNVERARIDRVLGSKEIRALIIALGTAIADDFNLEKLRYHRIILMADADSDGNHIKTLLLTLFYRYFKPIIEKGYLYLAQPPLYKIQMGKKMQYAYSDIEKETILKEMGKDSETTASIQRYKGLGEMNPEQLWETTMDPENRVLLQVTIENAEEADKIFDILMGDEVPPRKKFIQTYAKAVKNLDI
ncbi:intein-containing DNA gyrase subunit B, partial [Patescibacteria group bacterium]|nr:intein-containing DNA gyrase subunit B [Patescibacteria group bacterium]